MTLRARRLKIGTNKNNSLFFIDSKSQLVDGEKGNKKVGLLFFLPTILFCLSTQNSLSIKLINAFIVVAAHFYEPT